MSMIGAACSFASSTATCQRGPGPPRTTIASACAPWSAFRAGQTKSFALRDKNSATTTATTARNVQTRLRLPNEVPLPVPSLLHCSFEPEYAPFFARYATTIATLEVDGIEATVGRVT
jgi:hypothetical protein